MRVITGSARGRKLKTLEGGDIVRPTTDKVKEAMFSIVHFELEDAAVLDAFAGSGQLGIEALSRGARKAYFLDANKKAFETVKENLKTTNLFDRAVVLNTDTLSFFTGTKERFDVVLLDPPRKGCDEAVLRTVTEMCPQKIVYVSCDPATLARDAARLSELGYRTDRLCAADLFPRTHHVESVARMVKDESKIGVVC